MTEPPVLGILALWGIFILVLGWLIYSHIRLQRYVQEQMKSLVQLADVTEESLRAVEDETDAINRNLDTLRKLRQQS